jgi:uncharacterized protein YmfQ (DUF2313 family)
MGMSGRDYRHQLQWLLPHGIAWPREPDAVLTQLLEALAAELARVDDYIVAQIVQMLPDTTTDLLPEWEAITGLPGKCTDEVRSTLAARRIDVMSKLAASGGASRDYFISIAATYGVNISISEYRPFRVGINAPGDALTNNFWPHTWCVRVPGLSANDSSRVVIECLFSSIKPAHTIVIFDYGKPAFLRMASGDMLRMASGNILSIAKSIDP